MANLVIRPASGAGNKVVVQDQAGAAVLTTADSGATIASGVVSGMTGIPAAGLTGAMASGVTTIPAAGVTGVLPSAVTGGSGLTALGTVTTGSVEDITKFNGLMRYAAASCHNTSAAKWENQVNGMGDGFLRNPDSCMTHTDDSQTITINSAGIYFVYTTLIPITAAAHQSTYIRKNGVNQCDNRSGGSQSHGNAVSCILLNMAVNDTIDVVTETNIHKGLYGNIIVFKIGV